MGSRKALIIAGVALVIVVVAAFVVQKVTKKDNGTGGTGGNGTQTGTGGLGQPPTGTTNQGRGFAVVTDPTQPYVSGKPRGTESPADNDYKKDTGGNTGLTYEQKYNLGLVPDQNGYYKQLVDGSGVNQYMANKLADYRLSEEDFLNKYYPDYVAFNNGTTPSQQEQSNIDPVVADSRSYSEIPDVPEVSASQFKIIDDNSTAAVTTYLQGLANATNGFDLLYNDNLATSLLNLESLSEVQAALNKTAEVANAIRAVPVPSQLLNFSKGYLNSYQLLSAVLADERDIIRNPSYRNSAVGRYETDTTRFTDQLSQMYDNINVLKAVLE